MGAIVLSRLSWHSNSPPIVIFIIVTFGQLAKYTSAMYSELPPSEKEAWVARAEADKARYLHELASYVPPPGYDAKGDAIISPVNTKGGRKGKPEKDVNAPKRNMSAYLLYQNAMREQFKRENRKFIPSALASSLFVFSAIKRI